MLIAIDSFKVQFVNTCSQMEVDNSTIPLLMCE